MSSSHYTRQGVKPAGYVGIQITGSGTHGAVTGSRDAIYV